jgi:hypothetical protein
MAGRALVIGAVVGQIQGVENDVRAIAAFLAGRGFTVATLDPRTEATRDAILRSYHELIDRIEPGSDEPVVIYYAGHGGVVVNACDDTTLPARFQCIIPIDYAAGSEADFRGITSFELSALQNRLTARTRNVTVILDCCYSGQMSRDASAGEPHPRSLEAPTPLAMQRHLEALRERYHDLFSQPATSNPSAVRVMACGEHETAWPIRDAQGQWYGAFTLALLDVLRDIGGVPAAWDAIGTAISTRVRSSYPNQQPRIEGPRNRRIFSLHEEPAMAIPIQRTGATFTLDAGTLAGVAVGDIYAIISCAAPDSELARVSVTAVTPLAARAQLAPDSAAIAALPRDAIAVPRVSAAPRRPLYVEAASRDVESQIQAALASTRRLQLSRRADGAIAELIVRDDGMRLLDRTGPLLPLLAFPDRLPDALALADRLAAARDLLELEGAFGIAPGELLVDWGVVEDGKAIAQLPHGTVVGLDARIYVRVKNVSARDLVVQVLNIGVEGRISLVSSAAVMGMRLAPQQQLYLGTAPDDHELVGLDVSWPPGLPRSAPRLDTLLVIATTRAADLRPLEGRTGSAGEHTTPRDSSATTQVRGGAHVAADRDAYLMTSMTYLIDPELKWPWASTLGATR